MENPLKLKWVKNGWKVISNRQTCEKIFRTLATSNIWENVYKSFEVAFFVHKENEIHQDLGFLWYRFSSCSKSLAIPGSFLFHLRKNAHCKWAYNLIVQCTDNITCRDMSADKVVVPPPPPLYQSAKITRLGQKRSRNRNSSNPNKSETAPFIPIFKIFIYKYFHN